MSKKLNPFLPLPTNFDKYKIDFLDSLNIFEGMEESVVDLQFWRDCINAGFSKYLMRNWSTENGKFQNIEKVDSLEILMRSESDRSSKFFCRSGDARVLIRTFRSGGVHAVIAGKDDFPPDRAYEIIADIRAKIGGINLAKKKSHSVPINFCSFSQHRDYEVRMRNIHVPFWEEIKDNYPEEVRKQLNELSGFIPDLTGGKLLILFGEPGTGKSFYLRSLISSWQTWANVFYVTDPELFLGSSSYMMGVIQETGVEDYDEMDDMPVTISDLKLHKTNNGKENDEIPWRLLIMEDAGDLIVEDASVRNAQNSLARFLNLSDGLIGQGMKTLTIITSNEPLHRLHPAVSRNGRTEKTIEFIPFPVDEANRWLEKHGSTHRVTQKTQLADLYAISRGIETKKAVHRPGLGLLGG